MVLLAPAAAESMQSGRGCASAEPADTLLAAPHRDPSARAWWLTHRIVQWPGAPRDARYALYRSSTAGLRITLGAAVEGADARVPLAESNGALPPGIEERFRFVGAGARLQLPPASTREHASLLKDQVLLVREDDGGRAIAVTYLQHPGALDALYASAALAPDLGATVRPTWSRLALWAPTARSVSACVFPTRPGGAVRAVPLDVEAATGIWRSRLQGDWRGASYVYQVDVFVAGVGIVRNRVTDPYSLALTANSQRSVLLSLDDPATKPVGWARVRRPAPLIAPTDLTVYELHVRDFSAQDATVRAGWRGKYLAFAESRSAGMRHLRALGSAGVTDVHLLPVYDLSTVPEVDCVTPSIPAAAPNSEAQQAALSAVRERDCFNWGYDPAHYTVPEGSYATDARDPAARIREFRTMVQALHGAGLRVGLDVVYNHTFASGQHPRAVLDRIVPGYYHRLNDRGQVERSTCCENTATEHLMMAKLMVESAVTWVRQYRIDSFRFDLMGHQPRVVMEQLQRAVNRAAGRHVPLLGEGWNFGEVANGARFVQASQRSSGGSGIATFSDRARDALRGGGCCDGGDALVANQGLLNGLSYEPNDANRGRDRHAELLRAADMARVGLAGTLRDYEMVTADGPRRPLSALAYGDQPAGYVHEPGEVVNYVENHDNLTLFDLNALRLARGTSRQDRARAQVLGIAFVALSQGIAYLHAGVEILRSKSLDRDSFDSGDWFNRLDWSLTNNGFGGGLPPAHRNQGDWPTMYSALADSSIAPTPEDIRWTRNAALDLLRIRASSTLFRLRSAADVRARLRFLNVGPAQDPTVIVAHLQGTDYPGARFGEVLAAINVAPSERRLVLGEIAGKAWRLHPVHRSPGAADLRAREARLDASTGTLTVPARTAVVFVLN